MMKTMKLALLVCLALFACALMFTACDSGNEVHGTTEPETEAHVHSFGEWETTKNATCTLDGNKERYCSCGEKQVSSIPMTEHTFGKWDVVESATCTEQGVEARFCSCGEKETAVIAATGHTWINDNCIQAKTCSACGFTEGIALGHTTTNGVCTRCNEKIYIANSCTFICADALPKTYSSSTYYEYTYGYAVPHVKTKISAMTYTVNSYGNVELVFDCEVTYLWKITHSSLSIQILDSNGYTIATGFISAGGDVTQGTKYRATVTIYSSKLTSPGEYTVRILEDQSYI